MPYKTEPIPLDDPFLKGNTKLLPCQREMIVWWHDQGTSIHQLSRMFHVSRRTIQFILYPDRLKHNKELREERGGSSIYYDREYNKKAITKHRKKKHELLKHIAYAKNNSEGSPSEL